MESFLKISFDVTACVDFRAQEIPGPCVHHQARTIQIAQTEINEWRGKYKIIIGLPPSENDNDAADIGEEARARLVALFVIASRVDANATNELLIESPARSIVMSRPGDSIELRKMATPITIASLDSRIANRSALEWNALKRLKGAIISASFGDKFEALAGTIDALGKNDFPQLHKVGKRMFAYLEQRLNVSHPVAKEVIDARHYKVHENSISQNLKASFYVLVQQVADDLCVRFYLPIKINAISRMLTDDFGFEYASKNR